MSIQSQTMLDIQRKLLRSQNKMKTYNQIHLFSKLPGGHSRLDRTLDSLFVVLAKINHFFRYGKMAVLLIR